MISFVISTMNRDSLDFIEPMFLDTDLSLLSYEIIVINQSLDERIIIKSINASKFFNVKIVNTQTKGLSRSRNLGIEIAQGSIILFLDDDITIIGSGLQEAIRYLDKNSTIDVITMQMVDANHNLCKKSYSMSSKSHDSLTVFKISSMECMFRKRVFEKGIRFDTRFGLGSKTYNSGEEVILLSDILSLKMHITYLPIKFIIHHDDAIGKYMNIEGMYSRGAAFHRIFGSFVSLFFLILWVINKWRLNQINLLSVIPTISYILKGWFSYFETK
jgi:glycosyltransferase involved in cell wall biosynthesis